MAPKVPQRKIGDTLVSAIGLGCMGMSHQYLSFGGYDDAESLKTLTRAADMGITFWDTSDIYGPFTNEELLGRWFKETGRRDEIFLATKFGNKWENGSSTEDSSPAYVKKALNDSLRRLNTDRVDLYYQHRVDYNTPIEHTVQAMVELKNEGKIRYLGLSECSARTLRRAAAVHPIAAVQMEFSPFALDIELPETGFLTAARELGATIVAYSPLGRGFLTGSIKSRDDFDKKDSRLNHPRFSEENFAQNFRVVDVFGDIAKEKNCTIGQAALAWVMAQGEDFIPIPGTKHVKWLEENAGALDVHLSKEEEKRIRETIQSIGGVKGARYPPGGLARCFGDTVELDGSKPKA